MAELFNTYFYKPILAALIFIYQNIAFHNLGLAIVLLTFFVRIILFPLFYKSAKDQALMQRLQPHIKKIQLDHKDDKEKQGRELLALYRQYKLNPFSGIALLIVQLPVLIALYQVFVRGLTDSAFDNLNFLGLINLGEKDLILVVLAAIFQYFQTKMTLPSDNKNAAGKIMFWIGPVLTIVVLINLPSALALYWLVSVIFSIGQQFFINKKLPKLEDGKNNSTIEKPA